MTNPNRPQKSIRKLHRINVKNEKLFEWNEFFSFSVEDVNFRVKISKD
ncbi:conserved hypothetical protein [Tenacibaculum halocynthiae]